MMDLTFLRGRKIAVLGLGKTGLTSAMALQQSGVEVTAWDDNSAQIEAARAEGIEITDLGQANLTEFDFLLLSPGIPHTYPAANPVVARAKQADLAIVGDVELLIQADPDARFVGITGTNGKSTTTALIGHILHEAGMTCAVGGNLGPAVLGFDRQGPGGIYVLELSSYQLELTPSLAPDIGVLLNITPDHLERHGGMEGYVAAKSALFGRGVKPQTAIIGIDDGPSLAIAGTARDAGFAMVTISVAGAAATIRVDEGRLADKRNGFATDLTTLPALPGKHNWQNAAAAYAACLALGLTAEKIMAAMATFPGLAHRQQRIAVIDGVAYINDSKATNAEAVEKALACYDTIYWLAGGLPKAGGLNGLESLMPRIRHAFLLGEAEESFAGWLEGKAAYSRCGTLEHALTAAHKMAQREHIKGAVVLLSPACASWDQFRSFEHRGDCFAEQVRLLARHEVAA